MAASTKVSFTLVAAAESTHMVSTTIGQSSRRHYSRWLRPNLILGKIITMALAFLVYGGFKLVVYDTTRYISVVQHKPVLANLYRAHFLFWLVYLITSFSLVYFGNSSRNTRNDVPAAVFARTAVRQECPD